MKSEYFSSTIRKNIQNIFHIAEILGVSSSANIQYAGSVGRHLKYEVEVVEVVALLATI